MDTRQIELVQRSFAQASRFGAHVAATFYSELFAIDPALRPMFGADMVALGDKLMKMLARVVGDLDRTDAIVPVLQELALRHVGYGVEARHYATVGTALLRTLKHELGAEFTPETRSAWVAAYDLISSIMREAAYGPAASRTH